MKKLSFFLVATIAVLCVICVTLYRNINDEYRLIAVSWGDGKYGKAFYGVYVYMGKELENEVEIKAKIYIGRGSYLFNYFHDLGVIGKSRNEPGEINQWGKIIWKPDRIEIGANNTFFFPRAKLEQHR